MQSTIEVQGLTKRFGRVVAVDDLSFTVRPGEVTGFIGPNGAGKSTTIRLTMGLDFPQAGTATVAGRRYRDLAEPLTTIGTLLDARAVHPGRAASRPVVGGGRLIADTSPAELLARASGDRMDVRPAMTTEAMTVLTGAGATVATTEAQVVTVTGAGVRYSELRRHRASLEEAYMELTREVTEFAAPTPTEES